MSDVECDTENIIPLTTHDIIDTTIDYSNVVNEKYRADEIEQLFKMSKDSKQYIIIKNLSQLIKSDVWSTFGFPDRLQINGEYRIFPGLLVVLVVIKHYHLMVVQNI
jgi:hypothetical protein